MYGTLEQEQRSHNKWRNLEQTTSCVEAAEEDAALALELAKGQWLQTALLEIQVLRERLATMGEEQQHDHHHWPNNNKKTRAFIGGIQSSGIE